MKLYRYHFLLLLSSVLFSCDSGKHYFNKRISHPEETIVLKSTEKNNAMGEQAQYQPAQEVDQQHVQYNKAGEPVAEEQPQVVKTKAKQVVEKTTGTYIYDKLHTKHDRAQQVAVTPSVQAHTMGDDKEGFILLAVIAAVLIGLGLLFYFLFDVVGLIFLILFSVAAGILLILILLALIF